MLPPIFPVAFLSPLYPSRWLLSPVYNVIIKDRLIKVIRVEKIRFILQSLMGIWFNSDNFEYLKKW